MADLKSLQVKSSTPEPPKHELTQGQLEEIRDKVAENAEKKVRTEIMVDKHTTDAEAERRKKVVEAAEQRPKRRGRPPKNPQPSGVQGGQLPASFFTPVAQRPTGQQPGFAIGKQQEAPGQTHTWTDKGRKAKKKALKILAHPRLAPRLGPIDLPQGEDSDQGWEAALRDMQDSLASAGAEENVKGLFLSGVKAYETQSLQGRFNPLGLNLENLTNTIASPPIFDTEFADDLAELAIQHEEFFSSYPVSRLTMKTVKYMFAVNHKNSMPAAERMQEAVDPADASRFGAL